MKFVTFSVALLSLAACNSDRTTAPLMNSGSATLGRESQQDNENDNSTGVVFTLSNQASGNAVLVYRRNADGSLTAEGSVASGGNGTGAGLGSQGALVLSRDGDLLFAVNAGSNSVSSFRVQDDQLTLVSTAPSGGTHPISVTAARGLVYVLNDGGAGNIAGLTYSASGALTAIANSARALSSGSSAPAQVEFTPDADRLVVTEKGTNMIGVYNVSLNGLASAGAFTASSGQTPFGFEFRDNTLIVSEAFGGAPDASAVSSYTVGHFGLPTLVSASVHTTETAACWIAVTKNGRFAYTTNAGSSTISGYAIGQDGSLTLLDANGETASLGAGAGPSDMAVSHNNRYLYARANGNRTISAVRVHADGSLTVLSGGATGLPANTAGLAAR